MIENFFVNFDKTIKNGEWVKTTLITLVFGVLFSVLALFKGVFGDFIIAAIPMLIINEIIIFYAFSQGAKKSLVYPLCILNYISALSQALLDFAGVGVYFQLLICVVAILIFAVAMIRVNRKHLVSFTFAGMLLFLLFCLLIPESDQVGNVSAWGRIGGVSIQFTEVAKVFYVLCIGSLFSMDMSEKSKISASIIVTAIFSILLLAISELGTVLVVVSAFVCTVLTTFKKIGWKLLMILLVIVGILISVFTYKSIDKEMYKWKCPYCDRVNHDTQQCLNCKKTVVQATTLMYKSEKYDQIWKCPECSQKNEDTTNTCSKCRQSIMGKTYDFKCSGCHYTIWTSIQQDGEENNTVRKDIQQDGEETEEKEPKCKNCNNFYGTKIGETVKKVYTRFAVVYGYDKVQGTQEADHMMRNRNAIKVGGYFGNNDALIWIPNSDTDSIYAALINRMGLIFGIGVLLVFFALYLNTYSIKSPLRMLAICIFIFQAVYTFLGTLNLFPMTGVGLPLLSRGGTNLVASYTMIYFMLTSRHESEEKINV